MRSLAESRSRWDSTFANASSLSDLRASVKRGGEDNPCIHGLRSVCWKAFLVFEHLDQSTWPKTLRDARSAYISLKEHLLRDIKHSDSIAGDDPLADDETSPWNTLRKDELLRAEIFQDVERCMPENFYFREPKTQAILLDVLFVYCKLNADVGYRQGMHEILAPIVWVVSTDAIRLEAAEEGSETVGDHDRLILSMLSESFIEHDAFTIFGILMQTAKSFYETSTAGPPKSANSVAGTSAIVERSRRIHEELLHKVDPELAGHLMDIDILPQIFVIRWIRLLFSREFPFEDVLCLWDVMFAEERGLNLVDYVCVAMLLRVRWQLLSADHNVALAILLRYAPPDPPYGAVTFIEDAIQLRRSLTKETGNRLITKYSGKAPVSGHLKAQRTPLHSPNASEDFSHARSPLRSPGQILSDAGGGLEGLLQEAAKGVYRRSEQWGIGQAFRNAVQGLQSSGASPYRIMNNEQGSPQNDAAAISSRLLSLERRNKALAKLLQDGMEELLSQTKALEAQKAEEAANKLTLTIAKLQFIQVHLDNPSLPLAGHESSTDKQGSKSAPNDSSHDIFSPSPQPASPAISSDTLPTTQARRLSKSSESGRRSPVRMPIRRPPNISTAGKIATSQDSPSTPQPGSAFHQSRPSLASSSFSWMLGGEDGTTSFVSPTALAAERDRRSAARGKAGFLFGDVGDSTSTFKHKDKAPIDKEEDDGFTLGTLRGIDKSKATGKQSQ